MSKCKYSKCDVELDNPRANTCCDAHRKAWKRENPDIQPGQINPDTRTITTRTDNNPDKSAQPGQPIDVQPVNWADPSKDYSEIARKTDGVMLAPGDPGYKGVCVQVDGQWIVSSEPAPFEEGQMPHILKRSDLKHWRGSRPYHLDQDTHLAHLADEQLHRRISDIKQWQASPEYAERVYRLVHGLTAYAMPANMTEAVVL